MPRDSNPERELAAAGTTEERFAALAQPGVAPPDFSDDALALAFSERHAGQLVHVAEWGDWLRWDGTRWAKDHTLAVFDLARTICREAAARAEQSDEESAATRCAAAATVAAVERLARSDRRHARAADGFDADPWLLNTPAGVVDLRTGQSRPHRAGELFTKVAGVAPGGDCPGFRAFLAEIVEGDQELVAYLQRWAGYMLTGETREHAFLFVVGPGGNGKTLLLNLLSHVLGDYASAAPMQTFMASAREQHPTDLAMLRGARLVVAQETDAGQRLAEAKVKALTGGDQITARFMRGNFFTYRPAFKLVMVGNHRPVIRNPDQALRRRLHLLPLTFKPPRPNPALFDTLKAEAPGILAWMIEGCLIWQRDGLGRPEKVEAATAAYFADQDLLAQWLAERCEPIKDGKAQSEALYRDWQQWCEARGEQPGSGKRFSEHLEHHYAKQRTKTGAVFHGLRLLPSDGGAW